MSKRVRAEVIETVTEEKPGKVSRATDSEPPEWEEEGAESWDPPCAPQERRWYGIEWGSYWDWASRLLTGDEFRRGVRQ